MKFRQTRKTQFDLGRHRLPVDRPEACLHARASGRRRVPRLQRRLALAAFTAERDRGIIRLSKAHALGWLLRHGRETSAREAIVVVNPEWGVA